MVNSGILITSILPSFFILTPEMIPNFIFTKLINQNCLFTIFITYS